MFNLNKGNTGKSGREPGALGTGAYGRSKAKAAEYIQDKDKLSGLIDQASIKASGKKHKLKDVWSSLWAFFRLIRAYVNGSYRQISTKALLIIVAAIAYFVSPIDLIPDFIIGLGLIDDATILAWTIRACSADIAAFMDWENTVAERK